MPDTIGFKTVQINTSFVFVLGIKKLKAFYDQGALPSKAPRPFILGAAEVGRLADQIWLTLAKKFLVKL